MFKAMSALTVRTRLMILVGLVAFLMLLIGGAGIQALMFSNARLKTVYEDRTVALVQIGLVMESSYRVRNQLVRAVEAENPAQAEKYLANVAKFEDIIQTNWTAYSLTYMTAEERKIADGFMPAWKQFSEKRALFTQLITGGKRDEALTVRREMDPLFDPPRAIIAELRDLQVRVAKEEYDAAISTTDWYLRMNLVVILVGLILSVVVAYNIARSLMRQLGGEPAYVAEIAREIADGNLAAPITLREGDSDSLLAAMRDMRDSLARIVSEVHASTERIVHDSSEIAAGNQDLSQRTEQHASSIEETAASMEEVTGIARSNSDNSRQAQQLALSATNVATRSGEAVAEVVATMEAINHSSKLVADITSVIDSIAFQTNILALNAAVEAARAGEQGRGFAVVATEVRTLAQRSAAAAKEIKTLIDSSVQTAAQGASQVTRAGDTMQEVLQSVRQVADLIGELSSSGTEQAAGIEQINEAITEMDQVTRSNAALVEQSAAAASSLHEQAEHLRSVVSNFRLSPVNNAEARAIGQSTPRRLHHPAKLRIVAS